MSGVSRLYGRCMEGEMKDLIKGASISNYVKSPFLVWCEKFAPKEEKDPDSMFMQMIFQNGIMYEEKIGMMKYPLAVRLDPESWEKGFLQCMQFFFDGVQVIRNPPLYHLPLGLQAVPDILVRNEVKGSHFGDYHYIVKEVKSSLSIRQEHIMQAAFYNYIIGQIQGYTPGYFYLINGKNQEIRLEYHKYHGPLMGIMKGIREIFSGKQVYPERLDWPWQNFSLKVSQQHQALSLIPGIYTAHRDILVENGLKTLQDFQNANSKNFNGISHQILQKYALHSRAILESKCIVLRRPRLPQGKTEIFLDFEGIEEAVFGDSILTVDYLIGLLLVQNGKEEYIAFLSENPDQEHENFIKFLKFLKKSGDFAIYHYGSHERRHLLNLFQKYKVHKNTAEWISKALIDLHTVVKKSIIPPTTSYSLKDVAKFLGFRWRGEINATDSMALYMEFLKTQNRGNLEKIVQYNEDDCRALKRVRDFLIGGTEINQEIRNG